MRALQWGLGTIAIIVPFGLLAFVFGAYSHLALTLMMKAARPEPVHGAEMAAVALNVATAATCGGTCVLRLVGRPVARWAWLSLALVVVAVAGITAWRPNYFTLY
jgi:hypothetical protein